MEAKEEIVAALEEGLASVVEGAEADIRLLAENITTDIISMLESGEIDPDLMAEWEDQLKLVGETQRLRATNESWAIVAKMAQIAARVAFAAAHA